MEWRFDNSHVFATSSAGNGICLLRKFSDSSAFINDETKPLLLQKNFSSFTYFSLYLSRSYFKNKISIRWHRPHFLIHEHFQFIHRFTKFCPLPYNLSLQYTARSLPLHGISETFATTLESLFIALFVILQKCRHFFRRSSCTLTSTLRLLLSLY